MVKDIGTSRARLIRTHHARAVRTTLEELITVEGAPPVRKPSATVELRTIVRRYACASGGRGAESIRRAVGRAHTS